MYHLNDCCRACLSNNTQLNHITSLDEDSVRLIDKLMACVVDVPWQNEGYPLYICVVCTKKLPYACKHCDRRFPRNTELVIHMREHTGKVPYSCSVCNRGFVYQSHYKAHVVKHSREKPHVCVVCDKKFTTASYLHEHSRRHTGQKLFNCLQCDKSYTRSSFLDKHMTKHTGLKPML